MTRLFPLTCSIALLAAAAYAAQPAPTDKPRRAHSPQFSITLGTQQSTLPSGGELKIYAELRNQSAYSIHSGEDCSLELEVLYEIGWTPVPETGRWKEQRRRPDLRRVSVETKPGAAQECVFVVSEMYQIARPGRYIFRAKRRDFWGTEIQSNQLWVTVIAPYSPITLQLPEPAPPKPAFSIAISAPQAVIQSGADLPVKVLVTNVSDRAIHLDLDEASYWSDVRDEKGRLAPQTQYGHQLTGEQFAFPVPRESSFAVPIQTGASAEAEINVAKLFDLSRPGVYTIRVDKSDRQSKAWIQSNVIGVTVVAESAPASAVTPDQAAPAAPRAPAPPVAITLNTQQTAIRAGAEIWVDATTSNLSDHTVAIGFLPRPYESAGLSVIVQTRDSRDRPVGPERLDQSACKGVPGCKSTYIESRYLEPGQSVKDYFLLGKDYDFSKPGTYTIQVVRWDEQSTSPLAQPVKAVTAVSNALRVNVVEACTKFEVARTGRFDSEFSVITPARAVSGRKRSSQPKFDCGAISDLSECPRPVRAIDPKYTDEARQAQVEGKVVVGLTIDKQGRTSDVYVLEFLGKGLDEQAVAAVQQWRFRPALYKGDPIRVNAKAELEFTCADQKTARGH